MSGKLDYWRADNMWAARGRPDGDLGMETISLQPGAKRVFVTDWKYEKKRNDGTNYYGSHGRRLKNSGSVPVDVKLTSLDDIVAIGGMAGAVQQKLSQMVTGVPKGFIRLKPGSGVDIKADIQEVSVPKS